MSTFTPLTDIWTQGYDHLSRPCWENKKTREIYYGSSGQVPTQPHQAFHQPPIGTAQGKDTADMWTYGFDQYGRPCWLNKKTRKIHYDSVEGQTSAQPPRLVFTPTRPSLQSGPYFGPVDVSCEEHLPPVKKAEGKKTVDEEGQWYLQRNEKGEQYYLNTTTGQWQYENPYCLKKSTRGK